MTLRTFDAQLLDELLALGGDDLRDQLLADLSRCTRLMRRCFEAAPGDSPTPAQMKRDLHELRGIALTIGATGLTEYCLETENRIHQIADPSTRSRFDAIATACDALRADILARRADPA